MLGRENYAAISLAQLGGNRFAPANLEGKLANLSEESSGSDLSFEELNVIKDLSAGGEIQVERKGQQAFMLKNQAKLIFSANKTPRFHEQGRAIRSRLLVIPFDHTIEKPDASVEERLLQEVPKICSMLIRRIQENLKAHNGKFKVYRGGAVTATAQEKVLLAGNSAIEWSKEMLESSVSIHESKYITCIEAYTRYATWCQENNYRPMNSHQFGYVMTHGGLTPAVSTSSVKKIGGKVTRVYPHTQWKEEVLV
jgi:putative DNA primase/helicase